MQRGREPGGIFARRPQYVKRQPLRGFLADAGKAAEFVDQTLKGRRKIGHR